MKTPLLSALTLVIALGGCSSSWNPLNWGGSDVPDTLEPEGGYAAATADGRPLVSEVTGVTVERTPGGVILRATALPPSQGYWSVALVPETRDPVDGRMTYRFVAWPPIQPMPASTPVSREVTAARFINAYALESIQHISVVGATNQRTITQR